MRIFAIVTSIVVMVCVTAVVAAFYLYERHHRQAAPPPPPPPQQAQVATADAEAAEQQPDSLQQAQAGGDSGAELAGVPPQFDFAHLDSTLDAALKDGSAANRKRVASAFSSMYCMSLSKQTAKNFFLDANDHFRDRMGFIQACVSAFPESLNTCGDAGDIVSEFPAYKPFLQPGDSDDAAALCNYADETEKRVVLGNQRYGKLQEWNRANCGGGPKSRSPESRPSTFHSFMDTFSGNDIDSISNGIEKNCPSDFYAKETSLADLQSARDSDKLRSACQRASRYINADDAGKLVPEYKWSVPQTRPPVCVTSAPCTVHASTDQTALIGTLLSDAKDTAVGSIMPRFKFSQESA